MPTYDYECDSCNHKFEQWQSFKDDHLKTCPECKTDSLRRLFGGGAAIIFKGSGFYDTDYRQKDLEKKEKASGKKQDGDSKPADSTKESSTESKPAATESKPAVTTDSASSSSKQTDK